MNYDYTSLYTTLQTAQKWIHVQMINGTRVLLFTCIAIDNVADRVVTYNEHILYIDHKLI